MPQLPLGFGKYALVDASDLPLLAGRSWHLGHNGHAMAWTTGEDGRRKKECLHTVLLRPANPSVCIRHVNGDKLDYRRANLQEVTRAVAAATNWRYRKHRLSRFRGVTMNAQRTRWLAQRWITGPDGKRRLKFLGSFLSEEEAARAYGDQVKSEGRAAGVPSPMP